MTTATVSTPGAPPRSPLSRKRRVLFAAAAMLLSLMASLALIVGADMYLHRRAEQSAGLNMWGYRGPRLGGKGAQEVRIAFLGGSTMFGYGVRSG